MPQQITRRLRPPMRLEVTGRANNRRSVIRRHAHRDHVLFDVLAEVNSCVESRGNDIHATVIRGDIEHDVRVFVCELAKLWREYGAGSKSRHQQPHTASWLLAQPGHPVQSYVNL